MMPRGRIVPWQEMGETVQKLLSRNEWYTLKELMGTLERDPIYAMQVFRYLRIDRTNLRVIAPRDGLVTALWHGNTGDPSTKRLIDEKEADVWNLPFALRKTFTAKYKKAHAGIRIKLDSLKLVEAAMTVEEALAKNGLNTEHPRPSEGFPFQCVWRTNEPTPAEEAFSVGLTFTGAIRTDTFKQYRTTYDTYRAQVEIPGPNMKLKICRNFTVLDMLVGQATVDRHSKRLSYCPTRSDLLEKTRTLLIEHGSLRELVTPFTPIRCGFSLLSGNGHGRGE